PTALGLVDASSTINEPESPEMRKLLLPLSLLLTRICPVKVFVKAAPPAHSLSYATLIVALRPLTLLRVRPLERPLFFTAWPMNPPVVLAEIVPTSRIAPVELTIPEMT